MKCFKSCLMIVVLLAIAVPASAQWVDLSGNFTTSGLGTLTGLITDPTTDTLYAIRGNSIQRYNAGADSWTPLTASTFGGYAGGDNFTPMFYSNGKFLLKQHLQSYVQIYDISSNSWTKSDLPTGSAPYAHSQGATFDTQNGKLQAMWSIFPGGEKLAVASYDPAAGTWSGVTEYTWPAPGQSLAHWGGKQSVSIGTTDYIYDDRDSTPSLEIYDFTTSPFPEGATTRTAAGSGFDSGETGAGQTFGQQYMAVLGTDIYLTGGDLAGGFAVYDTLTDTWEILDSFPNGGGGYRDHSTAIADGVIYVQDFNQFFANQIAVAAVPEPASIAMWSLLGLSLAGFAYWRRKKAGRGE